ncbi:MAG: glycosyltransferase family 4 protein [Candidatus Acidiferrales bacterium]
MKIKLLLYSHDWFPLVGGVQTVTLSLATGLAEWGKSHAPNSFEVVFVTQTPANGMDDSRFAFPVIRRPSVPELIRYIRSADVLHLAGPTLLPLLFAQLLGTPAVVEHHGYQSVCPNGLLLYAPDHSVCVGHFMAGRYQRCIQCNARDRGALGSFLNLVSTFPRRWLCRHAAGNIAVSRHVAERIALPRTRTIYHGIHDAGLPRPEPAPSPTGGNMLRLAYVGRLAGEKGLPLLLDAAKRLDEQGTPFQLTFIGDGTQRAELEAATCRLHLQDRVRFTGELTGADFATALRAVQVVVMPSQWEETAGLAAMEQMMRGGVVVAADIGGLSEVVGDAGLKFFAKDSAALSACLRQLYENPSLVNTLGAAARARARQFFSLDSMIQAHVDLYEEVIPH